MGADYPCVNRVTSVAGEQHFAIEPVRLNYKLQEVRSKMAWHVMFSARRMSWPASTVASLVLTVSSI